MYRKIPNRSKIKVPELNSRKNNTAHISLNQRKIHFSSASRRELFSKLNTTKQETQKDLIHSQHFNFNHSVLRKYSTSETEESKEEKTAPNHNQEENTSKESKNKNKTENLSLDEIEEKIKNMDSDEIEELMKQAWKDGTKRKKQLQNLEMRETIREFEREQHAQDIDLDEYDRQELEYRMAKKEQDRREYEEAQEKVKDVKNPFYHSDPDHMAAYDAPLIVEDDVADRKKKLSTEYEEDVRKRREQAKRDEPNFLERIQSEVSKREKMVFLFLALFFFSMAFGPIYYGMASESWPETTGVVMPPPDRKQPVVPLVKYKIDGVTYFTQFWSWKYWSSFEELGELDLTSRFPPGSKMQVHYNPSNPGMAVLETGIGSGGFSAVGVGLGMLAALVFKNSWGRGVPAFGACCVGGMGVASYIKRQQRKETARKLEEEAAQMGA
eukprot:gb/GECH01014801.1/.p1 GENE.gb/GECH01014801.1/~~gb/GECH01014801.1/.p1  ORF type:complete len:440 (+),score=150.90 gb/GECH01014801.1/:1-1320(+)